MVPFTRRGAGRGDSSRAKLDRVASGNDHKGDDDDDDAQMVPTTSGHPEQWAAPNHQVLALSDF